MAAFCEANVPWTKDVDLLHAKVEAAVRHHYPGQDDSQVGFDTVIINYTIGQDALKGKRDKSKTNDSEILQSSSIRVTDEYLQSLSKKYGRTIRQHTRLTIVIEDATQTHKLQNDRVIQEYEIQAIQPKSEKTFQLACQTLDIDIISLDFSHRLPYYFKKTFIGVAIERGIHFEVAYSPASRDQTARRHTIANFLNLNRLGKGKNVLLASGCEKDIEIRSPYDVANLGLLFGLTEAQGKDAVSTNARALLLHAQSRRITSTVISITKNSELAPKDAWKVKNQTSDSSQSEDDDITGNKDGEAGSDIDADKEDDGSPARKKKKT